MTTPNSLPFPPVPEDGDIVIRGDLIGVYTKSINTWAINRLSPTPTYSFKLLEAWSDKDWPVNSLVSYKNQEYYSLTPVKTGDPAPGTPGSSWKNVTNVHKTVDLADVSTAVPTYSGQVLIWNGTQYVPGPVATTVYRTTADAVENNPGAGTEDKLPNIWPSLNGKGQPPASGALIIVAPGPSDATKAHEGAWFYTGTRWIKATSAASGGGGGTFLKTSPTAADTPNPPDPTNPGQKLANGMLQSTFQNLHNELKVWDGTAWVKLFTEDDIKQWIAAGSLFQSVIKEASISTLPTSAPANKGFYWTWTGTSNYIVKAGDIPLAPTLVGEVLNPGDWLQSDGTKYVHVAGDLLSKQRWLSLGGFQPWSDTSWESGSIVSYQKAFWRATAGVVAGDGAPGDGSAGNKWEDITPKPHLGLEDLKNVNANVIHPSHGNVFQWDDNVGEWVATDTLQIGALRFDDAGIGPEIYGFASLDITEALNDEENFVPSVKVMTDYIRDNPPLLEELEDCKELATAEDGQVPVWVGANSRWEPKFLSSPIIFLGNGAWVAADVADKAKNYGMPAGTNPDPQVWMPQPGDQYINTADGHITLFS